MAMPPVRDTSRLLHFYFARGFRKEQSWSVTATPLTPYQPTSQARNRVRTQPFHQLCTAQGSLSYSQRIFLPHKPLLCHQSNTEDLQHNPAPCTRPRDTSQSIYPCTIRNGGASPVQEHRERNRFLPPASLRSPTRSYAAVLHARAAEVWEGVRVIFSAIP